MTSVIENRKDDILILTVDNPSAANGLTREAATALIDQLRDASFDSALAGIIVTGAGRAFCAGYDLTEIVEHEAMGDNLRRWFGPMALAIHASRRPVVAAVNGACAGLGLSLALACHARVAARSAKFAGAFLQVGLVPDGGASYFLARVLGPAAAYRWITSGERLTAKRAAELGLVDAVVDDDELLDRAVDEVRRLAAFDALAASEAYRLLHDAASLTLAEVIEREAYLQDELGRRPTFRIARDAFFAARRTK
jgi:2-(1,2-epoxy-1,2-dihydrophenyl)acetyl-CoA isomerase